MSLSDTLFDSLPEEVRDTLRSYVDQTTRLYGPSMQSLTLYGSAVRGDYLPGRSNLNLLLLLSTLYVSVLQNYGTIHKRFHKEQIVVPVFLSEEELRRSASLFPLEYTDIAASHHVLSGRDPFLGLDIDTRVLGEQCEQEIRGNLIRLRQRLVEGSGTVEVMGILLPLSLTAVLACLRGLFRQLRVPVPRTNDALLGNLATTLGMDLPVLQEVWDLKRGVTTPGPAEFPRLMERYFAALEKIARRLAQLRTEGRL